MSDTPDVREAIPRDLLERIIDPDGNLNPRVKAGWLKARPLFEAYARAYAEQETAALRADAERYRWLREKSKHRPDFYSYEEEWMVSRQQGGMGENFFGDKIDTAIDTAMAAEKT